eukprot:gene13731-15163_t
MSVLETVSADTSFEGNQRSTSAGLAECFQTKHCSLATLRGKPEKILESVEQDFNPAEVAWKITRIRNRKLMDGEQMRDDPALTALDYWKRETFYVAMDKVSMGMEEFQEEPTLAQNFFIEALQEFCETYKLDCHRCADELFSFFKTFSKFNRVCPNDDEGYSASDDDDNGDDDDSLESLNDGEAHTEAEMTGNAGKETTGLPTDQKRDKQQKRMRPPSFIDALAILCHPEYMLIDAYPTLCQVYSIAVAVPVSSATAERSFSALKRVKTRIRSSMIQERLESLLAMTVERKILLSLNVERIIDLFARTSCELTKALL